MAYSRTQLNTTMKIYLCAITQNEKENMDELTREIHEDLDGLIIVDGGSTDGTKELMEKRKGDGAVIHRKWTNDHDFQMNEFLRQGPMKNGDWFILRDSTERLTPDFTGKVHDVCQKFDKMGIQTVYESSKILMARYYDDQFFLGSPHWGLQGQRKHIIRLRDVEGFEDPLSYGSTVRHLKRSKDHCFSHQLKYYYVYGRSNHMLLGNEDNQNEYVRKETQRQKFRKICEEKYKLNYTIKDLKDFLKTDAWKKDKEFIEIMNDEHILTRFYRHAILNEDTDHINSTQPPQIP